MPQQLFAIVRSRIPNRRKGQGAIEYALIMVGVSTATEVAVQSLGQAASDVFRSVGTALGGP